MTSRPDHVIVDELDPDYSLIENTKRGFNNLMKIAPDPTSFNEMSELLIDAKTFMNAAKAVPGGPVIKGVAGVGAVGLRRIGTEGIERGLTWAKKNVLDEVFGVTDDVINLGDGTLAIAKKGDNELPNFLMSKAGTTGRTLDGDGINPIRKPEVPQQVRMELSRIGSRGGIFNFDKYLEYKTKKIVGKDEARDIIALFQTDPKQYIRGKRGKKLNFKQWSKEKTEAFWNLYGPELSKRGIKQKTIQYHHIMALGSSIGLYDGLKYGSKEWYDLTAHLANKYISTGNNPRNLMRITGDAFTDPGTPHWLVHRFLDSRLGKQGTLLFDKKTRFGWKGNFEARISSANQLSKIIKESEAIAIQTQKAWDYLYGVGDIPLPDQLVDFMTSLPANKNYQLPELRKLALEAIIDMKLTPKNIKFKLPTQKQLDKFIKRGDSIQTSIFDENPSILNQIMSETTQPPKYQKPGSTTDKGLGSGWDVDG